MNEADFDTLEDDIASRRSDSLPVLPFLFVAMECDRPSAGGARYALDGVTEVAIGRGTERAATYERTGESTRLVVRLPGRSMSSTHARLRKTEEGWTLEDTRSTNGSFVNGKRIAKCLLQDRDVFELGHTLFVLREGLASPPDTAGVLDVRDDDSDVATLLPKLRGDLADLARFAGSTLPMLLLGKSGTGKEVLARAIHRMSGRKGPFIAVNCGALAPNLVESQLFGHTKGAFSGAHRDEPGFVRSAHGGTLLLDEIADLPMNAQPALLRVLQEQEVTPLGSARTFRIDIRVLGATHQPLRTLMAKKQFREDLFARLDGHRIYLPELDHRREDLGVILRGILRRQEATGEVRFSPAAGLSLLSRHWAFNVRQLVQCIQRALILADGEVIQEQHVAPVAERQEDDDTSQVRSISTRPLSAEDAALKERLLHELTSRNGNVTAVAQAMGKARVQISRWMKRFGIDPEEFRR
jgi:transcriptional regulator of acetoin/glycerol metabolism